MSAKLILKLTLLIFGLLITAEALEFGYETAHRLLYEKASYPTKAIFQVPSSEVEIILERRAAHFFLAEYERTLILRIDGADVLSEEIGMDTGGFSRMNIYRNSPTEYFLSGALSFNKYKIDIARQAIVSADLEEKAFDARFVGAFDRDENNEWRFISASERLRFK